MHVRQILAQLAERFPKLDAGAVNELYAMLSACVRGGGKLLVCGNGGSAADAGHIVGELAKGFLLPRPLPEAVRGRLAACEDGALLAQRLQCGVPAISLCSQDALLTAVGNDMGFELAFAQQVMAYGRAGDMLLGLSTSGNSRNVHLAAQTARAIGMKAAAIVGEGACALERSCDLCLHLPAAETTRIQEITLPVYHALCAALEAELFG